MSQARAHDEELVTTRPVTTPAGESSRFSKSLVVIAWVGGYVILATVFVLASRHAFAGNSDDATLVLQGQSVSSGHVALQGWALSYDSFWTMDVPFYAVAVRLLGIQPVLMNLVPAVIAALLVVVAIRMVPQGRRDLGSVAGVGLIVAVLALPGPNLAWFLLQAGWHASTSLWCLLIFVGVSRSKSRWALLGATVLVATGILGDLFMVTLAVIPLVLAGALAWLRQRDWRAANRHFVASVGGVGLALLVRVVAMLFGTYAISSRSLRATSSQVLANIEAIPNRVGGFFGLTNIVGGVSTSPEPIRLVRWVLFVVVVVAVIAALASTIRSIARGSSAVDSDERRVEDLLAIALLTDVLSFVFFATVSNVSLSRYLVPGFVFLAILAARTVTRFVRAHRALRTRRMAIFAAIVVGLCAADFGIASLGPSAPQPTSPLGAFLISKHLQVGIGDYWSSSIVTVDTSGQVAVRPVVIGLSGTLVRFGKQSTSTWYSGQSFQFFAFDAASDNAASAAIKTFGSPAQNYTIGNYQVFTWPHDVKVDP